MVTRWFEGFPHLRPLDVLRFSGGLRNLKEHRRTGVVEFGTDGVENSQGQPHATLQQQAEAITAAATRLVEELQNADTPDEKPTRARAKRGTAGTFAGRRPPKSPSKRMAPPQ